MVRCRRGRISRGAGLGLEETQDPGMGIDEEESRDGRGMYVVILLEEDDEKALDLVSGWKSRGWSSKGKALRARHLKSRHMIIRCTLPRKIGKSSVDNNKVKCRSKYHSYWERNRPEVIYFQR